VLTQDRRRFWIIKHGIKASGMPAWGPGHDDERLWNMVALLKRLPDLSPEQYQILTARGGDNAGHH
jgi:mono/diheme cytochrome c family protein